MELLKLGIVNESQLFDALKCILQKKNVPLPDEMNLISSCMFHLTSINECQNSKQLLDFAKNCKTLMKKCLFILVIKLELNLHSKVCKSLFTDILQLTEQVNTEEMNVHLECNSEQYSYGKVWEIIHQMTNVCSSLAEYQQSLLHDFFFLLADDITEMNHSLEKTTYMKKTGLVFSSYLQSLFKNSNDKIYDKPLPDFCQKMFEVGLHYAECHHQELNACLNLFVEPYLKYSPSSVKMNVLDALWVKVSSSFSMEGWIHYKENIPCSYSFLVFIITFVVENNLHEFYIIYNIKFWFILQQGLVLHDSLARKRSRYILKQCISIFISEKCVCQHFSPIGFDKADNIVHLWNEYVLCLDTLEENQSHVIAPVLSKITDLWLAGKNGQFYDSWIYVLYKRMFDHESSTVRLWAVKQFLQLDFVNITDHNLIIVFVMKGLLPVLEDYQLFLLPVDYSKTKDAQPTKSTSLDIQLSSFFSNLVRNLSKGCAYNFIQLLLSNLFYCHKWDEISLYHVVRSVSSIPITPCLIFSTIEAFLVNAHSCLITHEPILKFATQNMLYQLVLSHLCNTVTLEQLAKLLDFFGGVSYLSQNKDLWKCAIEKTKDIVLRRELCITDQVTDQVKFCNESLRAPSTVAIKIVLVMEVSTIGTLDVTEIQTVVSYLSSCHSRPYITDQKLQWTLETLCNYMDVLLNISNIPKILAATNGGVSFLSHCMSILHDANLYLFSLIAHLDTCNTKHLLLLITTFSHLAKYPFHDTKDHDVVQKLAAQYWAAVKQHSHSVNFCYESHNVIFCLNFVAEVLYTQLTKDDRKTFCVVVNNVILNKLDYWLSAQVFKNGRSVEFAYEVSDDLPDDSQIQKRSRVEQEDVAAAVWNCLLLLVEECNMLVDTAGVHPSLQSSPEVVCDTSLEAVLEQLHCAGRGSIRSVAGVAQALAQHALERGEYIPLVRALLSVSAEYRTSCSSLSRHLMTTVLAVLLQPQVLCREEELQYMLQECMQLMQSMETVRGVAPLLARRLLHTLLTAAGSSDCHEGLRRVLSTVLVPLLLHGPLPSRQMRGFREAEQQIQDDRRGRTDEEAPHWVWSSYDESGETRCLATLYLLTLDPACLGDVCTAGALTRDLQERFTALSNGKRTRDFLNSSAHRVKTRALQAMMVLVPLLDQLSCQQLLQWACEVVCGEQQQASVRYLLEWLLAALVLRFPLLEKDLLQRCREGAAIRTGSIASFLAAVTLLARHSSDASLLEHSLELAVPWCMGQHYNTRLYAQVAVTMIWERCLALHLEAVTTKFGPLQQCLRFGSEESRPDRSSDGVRGEFFFTCFHPVEHHTLQTIYYELPRLSLLGEDEWITGQAMQMETEQSGLRLRSAMFFTNSDDGVLAAAQPALWVVKAASVGTTVNAIPLLLNTDEAATSGSGNMQRKMMPWSSLSKQLRVEALETVQRSCSSERPRSPLIVVASLLTKATNLGGLCRTCEALGAGLLVVPSLAVLHDQAFAGLSLAAHKWMPLQEVNSAGVREFVRARRAEGYAVVAAEQTAHSVALTTYSFPPRTLLLLGNEREGIPCALLQEVDTCVEIPQYGVTRSLNAHVAGALCVWEYARQHGSPLLPHTQ